MSESRVQRARGSSGGPHISVVTPSLDQGPFLEGNIRSVLEQGFPDFEHIVVDGRSTDQTLEVLERFPHVRWISEKDRNMTEALNKGFRMARGEVIAWLNVDDRYPPGVFELLADRMAQGSGVDALLGDARVLDRVGGGEYVAKGRAFRHEEVIRYWERPYFLHQPAVFFRRRLLDEIGYLDESLDHAMDYELWLRLSKTCELHYVPRVLAVIVRHPGCKTADPADFHRERREISRRWWGPSWSPLRWVRAASYASRRSLEAAYQLQAGGRRIAALARLAAAAGIHPGALGGSTWWAVLARSLGAGGAVDALKKRRDRDRA